MGNDRIHGLKAGRIVILPLLIFVLFLAAGCGRKGDPIAPEDIPSKERPQPQRNESTDPGPFQGPN